MTIKQVGGIFGRNPSFNEVEIDGDLTVDTSTLFVDATNNKVGIGRVTPTGKLHVESNDASQVSLTRTGIGTFGIGIVAGDALIIQDGSVELVRFSTNGNVSLSNGGNLVMNSGQGIDFSATSGTGTSELFDDYEEGTWTPTYSTTGTDFTSVTYNSGSTEGTYTKIGNMVNVRVSIRTDAVTIGSASGTVKINGLPFTASSNKNAVGCYSGLFSGDNPRIARAVSDSIFLYYRTSGNTADTPLAPADLGTGANNNDVIVSLCYQTS